MPQTTQLTASDLRVHPSLRMHDHPDGGGAMSGTPLTGEPGEIFPPVSDVDRVKGAFDARLLYFAVSKPGKAALFGAHAIISKPPKADNVSFLLFPATKYAEERREIMQRIEAYSVGTIESRMTLLSTQTKNSKIVQAYQRTEEPIPQVGDVYCLRQDKKGYPQAEQYIQCIKVSSEDRTFYDPQTQKEFVRTVVKMELSTALNHDFIGAEYPSQYYIDNPCKIRETHVADGANYYGLKPLAAAVQANALKIRVPSIFEKIIPTSQIETSLPDLTAAGQRQPLFNSGKTAAAGLVTVTQTFDARADTAYHLGNAVYPGSIQLTSGSIIITDDGGTLTRDGEAVGTIDYPRGEMRFITDIGYNTWTITFHPAATVSKIADTAAISVALNNRSYNYLTTIIPSPSPGTMTVSYRAQGKWYDLSDTGSGNLRGASAAHGSGNINFASGTVTVTCGAMPDVGSEILFAWGNGAGMHNRSDSQPTAKMLFRLAETAIAPNSINMSWNDGSAKTATDDGAGNITGDWAGKIDYRSGVITIDVTDGFTHSAALDVTIAYSHGDPQSKDFKAPLRSGSGQVTLNLEQTQIKPRSFRMTWNLLIEDYNHLVQEGELFTRPYDPYKTIRDDGNGKLVDDHGTHFGMIDYSAGTVTFTPDTTVKIPKAKYQKIPMGERIVSRTSSSGGTPGTEQVKPLFRYVYTGIAYINAAATMPIDETALVQTTFRGQQTEDAATETLPSGTLDIDLLPTIAERIVPDSVRFVIDRDTYFDRRGELYYQLDAKTGAATRCGTINYDTGIATITQWTGNYRLALQSLATALRGQPVDEVVFRTPSAPLRPQSLVITATPLTGGQINVHADADGIIKSNAVDGYVEYETGVVRLRFGRLVDAAGNESEPWYNVDEVDGGKIWKPAPVHAESITFSAVAYSYLPLNTEQIGIDAVRLPSDGLVPWIRRGDMIIIANHQSESIGGTHTGNQTVQLSRQNVDKICVRDADDKPVLADLYSYDLVAGTLTWTDPLDLSGYKMPLTVHNAIERENRVTDVDINGELTLQFPLDVDFPVDRTYVSNALIGGDLEVRASAPFSQQSWNKQWSDLPTADPILAKLNVTDHPIELSSDSAVNQRWAIQFTSDSQFRLIGETLGLIAEGNILSDFAPINASTGKPYFKIARAAFGSGWNAGNIVRFNTNGTMIGAWLLRAIQPSSTRQQDADGVTTCLRGNTIDL